MHMSIASNWGVWVPDDVDARRFELMYKTVQKQIQDAQKG